MASRTLSRLAARPTTTSQYRCRALSASSLITDSYSSPEKPFIAVTKGNTSLPSEAATFATNSGPFGYIENNNYTNNAAYEQIQWLKKDLANVDRSKTPWIFAMSHRPMCAFCASGRFLALS